MRLLSIFALLLGIYFQSNPMNVPSRNISSIGPDEKVLLTLTSDAAEGEQYSLTVKLDPHTSQITHFKYSGTDVEDAEFPVTDLKSGIIMLEKKTIWETYRVVELQADHFDPYTGGKIIVKYLSGLSGDQKSIPMFIRLETYGWEAYKSEADQALKKSVSSAYIDAKTIAGVVIGVKSFEFKY